MAVPELHPESPLDHEKQLVFVVMLMPDELPLEFYQLDVLPVQLAHDPGIPVIVEEGELLLGVHRGDRLVSEDLRRSPSLSMDLSFPYHQIRARRRECFTPGEDPQKGHRSDDSYLRPTRRNPSCKLSRCGSKCPKGSISSSGKPTSSSRSKTSTRLWWVLCPASSSGWRSAKPRGSVWYAGREPTTQWSNWHARTLRRSPPVTVSSCFSAKASTR